MDSPRGGSGRDDDTVLDTGSEGSHAQANTLQPPGAGTCRWRTAEFHDQECSHYFDCPSHQIERRLSIDEPNEEQDISNRLSNTHIDPPAEQHGTPPTQSIEAVEDPSSESPVESPLRSPTAIAPASPPAADATSMTISPTETEDLSLEHPSPPVQTQQVNADIESAREPLIDSPRQSTDSADTEIYAPPHPASAPPDHPLNAALGLGADNRDESVLPSPSGERAPVTPTFYPQSRRPSEFTLPRWQPDAEVTYCPICHSQFNIFVRKHHCRKCGRVVCNACSPHRIIIPHQYIVRPPGSEIPLPQSLLVDGLGGGYFDVNGLSGGERVRLCNPCVPDPNTAPPQSPTPPSTTSPRNAHHRSRSSLSSSTYGPAGHSNRYSAVVPAGPAYDNYRYYSSRSRSITMAGGPSSRHGRSDTYRSTFDHIMGGGSSTSASTSYPTRIASLGSDASSSRQRALPPTPQIAEEDECPICHRELPSRSLPDFEAVREAHITSCIQTHSTYGSPRGDAGDNVPPPAPRRTGMYAYTATEKDCIDDAECTICLEEFTPKVRMARLECLCRFHYSCISAWFVNHPGRCPVHQHDGFGY